MDKQFRRYSKKKKSHLLIIQAIAVTLTLKMVNQVFHMAHHLIEYTTTPNLVFKKWLSGSGDIE